MRTAILFAMVMVAWPMTASAEPCAKLVKAYETAKFGDYIDKFAMVDYSKIARTPLQFTVKIAAGCRDHESFSIEHVQEALLDGSLKESIPVQGAADAPDVQAEREAFSKWMRHKAPKPSRKRE